MAGAAGTEAYNAAGNSDFSRKAMELAQTVADLWIAPRASENDETNEAFQARRMRMSPAQRPGETGTLSIQVQQWEGPSVAVTNGTRMTRSGDRSEELLLTGQAMKASENWSSPKASDPEKADPNMRGSKGDVPLPGQAVNWAAPAAQNHKGSSEGSITRADGKSREDILSYQAEQFFRPPSSLDQPIAGGSMSSTDSPNSNQPSVKRKLNPIFVEALMRWPTGLSGFERPAMGLTLWLHVQLGFLSALYSASEVSEEQYDMFGAAA